MASTCYPVETYSGIVEPPIVGRVDDRATAGRQLAVLLRPHQEPSGIVLALTPGGVIVAGEIARNLRLSLDALVTRTFAIPPYSVAAGAVCEGAGLCLNNVVW